MSNDSTVVMIKVQNVGQAFGCVGIVVARNGRRMAETRTFPHGMRAQAYQAALSLAAERGYRVIDEDAEYQR